MCYGKEREYSPCMSACPKTCDNFNDYDKIRNNCPLSPVEGCSCEDGMVNFNFNKIQIYNKHGLTLINLLFC